MKEAMHVDHGGKKRGLREIFMLCEGQEGAVEVAVRQEYEHVVASMRAERKDACNGGFCGSKDVVMARTKPMLNAGTIKEREESHDEVIGVGNRVDVH